VRPRYLYKKQFKIDYETQFLIVLVLNDEIGKNQLKKGTKKKSESTRVNPLSIILGHDAEIT